MGGRALLRRKGGGLTLCAGDAIRSHEALKQAGVPQQGALSLERDLAAAEAKLDPQRVAMFSRFEGMVMMDGAKADLRQRSRRADRQIIHAAGTVTRISRPRCVTHGHHPRRLLRRLMDRADGCAARWIRRRFGLGDAEVTVVSDGPLPLGLLKGIFIGVPDDQVKKMLSDNFLSPDNVALEQNSPIVKRVTN
jgi:hypothetical protein